MKDPPPVANDSPGKELGAPPASGCTDGCTDPDLARVLEAWPTLPEPIRAAVLALVQAAGG
jgi:hypothetical protein